MSPAAIEATPRSPVCSMLGCDEKSEKSSEEDIGPRQIEETFGTLYGVLTLLRAADLGILPVRTCNV